MRKREKRTDRECGLGNLSNLEIDVRAHGLGSSGSRQYTGMRNSVCVGLTYSTEMEIVDKKKVNESVRVDTRSR